MTLQQTGYSETSTGTSVEPYVALDDTCANATEQATFEVEGEQRYRASAYGLLASLLRSAPDQAMLDHVATLANDVPDEGDDMLLSMATLGLSAKMHDPAVLEDEFHELFIGIGKGELSPYASWYLTGFLMEKPLSDLREDLAELGYQRSEGNAEPEDHAASLCEVMSMLILDNCELSRQRDFCNKHILSWMGSFMRDMSDARSAVFYQALGRFGAAFLALEGEYLAMQS